MQPKNLKHLHPNVPYQNKMFIKLLHKKRAENCITLDEKIEIEKPKSKMLLSRNKLPPGEMKHRGIKVL